MQKGQQGAHRNEDMSTSEPGEEEPDEGERTSGNNVENLLKKQDELIPVNGYRMRRWKMSVTCWNDELARM